MNTIPTLSSVFLALLLLLSIDTTEAQKPIFHLRPPDKSTLEGPSGPYRDPITKKLHLFARYSTDTEQYKKTEWYHFTSTDYMTWQDMGIALPNNQRYDADGVRSGSITANADGVPVVVYECRDGETSVSRACIAVPPPSDVDGPSAPRTLDSFMKLDSNPVMTAADIPDKTLIDELAGFTQFWRNPDNASEWLVAFGVTSQETGGRIVAFKTADPKLLSGFKYSHDIWTAGEKMFLGYVTTADFWSVGSKRFLAVGSPAALQDFVVYGDYDTKNANGQTVFAEDPKRAPTFIDYGQWYASRHIFDPLLNRTILFGWTSGDPWFNEEDSEWTVLDMPRNVEYDEKAQKMKTYPMPELEKLRMEPSVKDLKLDFTAEKPAAVTTASGRHYELVVDFEMPDGAMANGSYKSGDEPSFGVDVLSSADGKQYTRIAVAMPPAVAPTGLIGWSIGSLNVTDAAACEQLCESDRRCVEWAFRAQVNHDYPNNCDVRKSFGAFRPSTDPPLPPEVSGRVKEPVLLLNRAQSGTTGADVLFMGRALLHNGNKVQLRIFVDGGVVQVFKDGGLESLTSNVHNDNNKLTHVSLFASNIKGTVRAVATLYPMGSIY